MSIAGEAPAGRRRRMKMKGLIRNSYSLLAVVLLAQAGLAAAAPGRERPARVGAEAGHPAPAKTWLVNLGEAPARIAVESLSARSTRGSDLVLDPGRPTEAPEAALAALGRGQDQERVLVLRTAEGFDPRSLEVELAPTIELERQGDHMVSRYRPEGWLADLAMALGGPLAARQTGRAELVAGDTAAVAVALLEADSAVDVVLRDAQGAELRSFALSAAVPAKLRLDLGALRLDGAEVELRVVRGKAAGTVSSGTGGMQRIFAASTVGTARYGQKINYSGSLLYTISGGPPNTCGELDTYRNGSWLFAPGWVCTDAFGQATKGPWYWANTPSDQTDDPTFIKWPDGSTTSNDMHIWDKNCAVTYRDAPVLPAPPNTTPPPTSYNGHATDTTWGAGFDFGPHAFSCFKDRTTGLYWDSATGQYSSSICQHVTASLSHVNRWYVTWSTAFPAAWAHTSGHTYDWFTCVDDGSCADCGSDLLFIAR
jgi:hypothetical protein